MAPMAPEAQAPAAVTAPEAQAPAAVTVPEAQAPEEAIPIAQDPEEAIQTAQAPVEVKDQTMKKARRAQKIVRTQKIPEVVAKVPRTAAAQKEKSTWNVIKTIFV